MHYYKKNIGDYAKKTGRISMLVHGAYTLLLDACYDRERFPTRDEALDWTCAESLDEIHAVECVLRKFFTLEDGFYVQKRIKEEIENFHKKSIKNKEIAIQREANKKQISTKRAQNKQNREPNHKPLTINHNKLTTDVVNFYNAPEQVIADFKVHRKTRRASITQTVIDGFKSQAEEVGLNVGEAMAISCFMGWTGFRANWIHKEIQSNPCAPYQTEKDRVREWMNNLIGKKTEDNHAIIDM